MDRKEAINKITEMAKKHGCKTGFYGDGEFWIAPDADEKYICFVIDDLVYGDRCDFKRGKIAGYFEVRSSLCGGGGNPTPEELLKAAEQIKQGALLTQELQNTDLSYEYYIPGE